MNEYTNKTLEAIEALVNASINKVSFDQTITAKIISQDTVELTKYLVETDNLKFYAYSGDTLRNYSSGTKVKVLIPNGDYSEEKIILGSINSSNEETKNEISANKFASLIIDKTLVKDENFTFLYNPPYDYIGASFYLSSETNYEELEKFFIKIYLDDEKKYYLLFSNEDIFGNPKDLNSVFPQNKLYVYPKDLDARNIKISYEMLNEGLIETNSVELVNYKLNFGYKDLSNNQVRLFSAAAPQNIYPTPLSEDIGYLEYYDGEKIYSLNSKQQLSNEQFAILKYTIDYPADKNNSFETDCWKQINVNNMSFVVDFNLQAKETRYKAIVKKDKEFYNSDILVYTNKNMSGVGASTTNQSIVLTLDDGDDGVYNYYSLDGHIKNNLNTKPKHIIAERLDNGYVIQPDKDTIEWFYPDKNTGLDKISTDKNILTYYLKSQCYPSWVNNTVVCRITRADTQEIIESNFTFQFGGAGNAGTEYSLNIDYWDEIENNYSNQKYISPEQTFTLKALFERIDGQALDIEVDNWEWEWYGPNCGNININNDIATITLNSNNDIKFAIIKLTVKYNIANLGNVYITEYFPITVLLHGLSSNEGGGYAIGPNRVVYNMNNDVSYDQNSYDFYNIDNQKSSWAIQNYNYSDTYHVIQQDRYRDNKYYLKPIDGIFAGSKPPIVAAIGSINGTEFFSIPIITLHNSWQLQKLNTWSGVSELTEEGVFSPFIAAGTKDSDNKFTGSVLGDIENKFGLYGFQNGILRYKLTEEGKFYVGVNEYYISFNENDSGYLLINAGNKFKLNENGLTVGGWNVLDNKLYTLNEANSGAGINIYGAGAAFWAGQDGDYSQTGNTSAFHVYHDGSLYASNVEITGKIAMTSGYIANSINFINQDSNFGIFSEIRNTGESNILYIGKSQGAALDETGNFYNRRNHLWPGIEFTDPIVGSYFDAELRLCGRATGNIETNYAYISLGRNVNGSLINSNANQIRLGGAVYCDNSLWQCNGGGGLSGTYYLRTFFSNASEPVLEFRSDVFKIMYYDYNNWYTKLQCSTSGGSLYGTWTQPTWSSDERLKNNIQDLSDKYEILFDKLHPVSYKYNNGTSNRDHTGYVAQEVVEAIKQAGLTTQNFAAVMFMENPDKQYYGNYDNIWFLRRDEFVALNTWQIQKLKARVNEQEKIITELQNEIKEIKNNEIN